jgi:hypothetical protein
MAHSDRPALHRFSFESRSASAGHLMRTDRRSGFEHVFYCDPWDGPDGISHPRFALLYRCRLRGSDRADGTRRLQHHRLGSSEGFVAGDDEAGRFVAGKHQLENRMAASGSDGHPAARRPHCVARATHPENCVPLRLGVVGIHRRQRTGWPEGRHRVTPISCNVSRRARTA